MELIQALCPSGLPRELPTVIREYRGVNMVKRIPGDDPLKLAHKRKNLPAITALLQAGATTASFQVSRSALAVAP